MRTEPSRERRGSPRRSVGSVRHSQVDTLSTTSNEGPGDCGLSLTSRTTFVRAYGSSLRPLRSVKSASANACELRRGSAGVADVAGHLTDLPRMLQGFRSPIPLKPRATKRIDEAARSLGAASGLRSQRGIRRTVECQSRSEALLRSKQRLRPRLTLGPQSKTAFPQRLRYCQPNKQGPRDNCTGPQGPPRGPRKTKKTRSALAEHRPV